MIIETLILLRKRKTFVCPLIYGMAAIWASQAPRNCSSRGGYMACALRKKPVALRFAAWAITLSSEILTLFSVFPSKPV